MRGCSDSIQALTIASSADMLSPHCALSKPLNLYTLLILSAFETERCVAMLRASPVRCCSNVTRIVSFSCSFYHRCLATICHGPHLLGKAPTLGNRIISCYSESIDKLRYICAVIFKHRNCLYITKAVPVFGHCSASPVNSCKIKRQKA